MVNVEYLYNPTDAVKNYLDKSLFLDEKDEKLGFEVVNNGTILPYKKTIDGKYSQDGWGFGGIVDGSGNYLRRSFVNSGAGQAYTPPQNQFNIVLRQSFILECFIVRGVTLSPMVFSGFGF